MDNGELHGILSDIKQQKKEGFEELYSKYYKLMVGVAFCVVRNEHDCHDIIQQVMLKLYSLPEDKFPEKYDMSWLYTVVKNEALQFLRKNKDSVCYDELHDIAINCTEMENVIDMDTYDSMVKSLDGKAREIVTLKVLCGMTHKEIGSALKIPSGTVQWKYHMSVNSLKMAMASLCILIINFVFVGKEYLSEVYRAKVVERTMVMNLDAHTGMNPILSVSCSILALIALIIFIQAIIKYVKITRRKNKINGQNNQQDMC